MAASAGAGGTDPGAGASAQSPSPSVTFTREGFLLGARVSLPLMIGLVPFGLVVGVTAQAHGLSALEAALMSGIVLAGSAQLVSLSSWTIPASLVAATLTCLVINLRFALMGPTLAPWLDHVHGWKRWGNLFLLVDHVWALSVQEIHRGGRDLGFFFGAGALSWIVWVISTIAGFLLGELVQPEAGHPMFFTALAAFIAMLVPMWRGAGRDLLPWVAAAITALAVSRLLPGTSWHILAGALVGGISGYLRDRRSAA
jgi:4-azaleucine resistance transporter AzlC